MTRATVLDSRTHKCKTPTCGNCYVTVCFDSGALVEVHGQMGKSGTCARAHLEALGDIISLAIEHGTPIKALADALRGISCQGSSGEAESCISQLGNVLAEYEATPA